METQLVRYSDLDARLLTQLAAIRDADARFDSPFFDLEFARQLSLVRDDTRIALLRRDGDLAGYWAMHVRPGGWARPVGTAFSDWHGPVVGADFLSVGPEVWLKQVGLKGMTINGLAFANDVLRGGEDTVAVGQAVLNAGGAASYLANQRERFPKYAKNIRRAERLIEKDFGGMSFTADDRSQEALDWLLSRKSAQYAATGLHDVLAPGWVQSLMRNLTECKTSRFAGRLSTLRFGEHLVAAELDLLSDKIVHGWITVFDNDYARYSPGHLLIRDIICDMERTGHVMADMGPGDASYKKYYETYFIPASVGTVRCANGLRPLARGWQFAETVCPDKISATLASIRRRTDQIAGTDLNLGGRISGFAKALSRRPRHK
jgi:CelD/BcsL family acetyltransferase involved in cellulose biosynthesis